MVFSLHILNTGRLRILLDQDGIVLRLEREITNKLFIFNVVNKYALQPCTDTPLAWRGPWVCGDTDELRAVGIFAAAVDTRTWFFYVCIPEYVSVCTFVCIHVYMCMCTYIHVYIYIRVYIHIYLFIYTYIGVCVYIYIYVDVCIYTYMCVCVFVYI